MAGLAAAQPATRQEVYRRLLMVQDYLHAHCTEHLSLGEPAQVAALSPNRLIQYGRQAFGVTPWQDVRRQRLAEARRRLRAHPDPPSPCWRLDLGWASASAFSTAYRACYGVPPRVERTRDQAGDFKQDG